MTIDGVLRNVSQIEGNQGDSRTSKDMEQLLGLLNIPAHITDLAIGDLVMCCLFPDNFEQGAILRKWGEGLIGYWGSFEFQVRVIKYILLTVTTKI